jgi:RNA polymerase sigma-70 factor (ECF subfamily)
MAVRDRTKRDRRCSGGPRATLGGGADPLDDLPAVDDDPLERLRLIEGLSKISDEHREVVLAVHVDGLSYAELSKRTGIPVPTLRTRAFYGLRALRAHLDGPEDSDVAQR